MKLDVYNKISESTLLDVTYTPEKYMHYPKYTSITNKAEIKLN